ncbi:hypothetical protein ABB37_08680 [Leptomonas pyrrhocoris]|uniref:Uncharacterized protein n=1 Tax=Leptomonas pyrrhocoris TaxID=157538 RepID=A0A0M9FSW1_LEPPY|nr:hypothetical protein ABB37_08680 [Leptomonas pyrrhocoris]KPA75410.1 hypothetical protein ABB37_08680 [Leptomonas pyrrhocoris]|eukprot:XP_015653849.1 hypothetical protein ABB37_08680 [Leptomonas pyrrhocoris]
MVSKERKRPVGVPFTVNGVPYRTRVGCHEVKSRYGHEAVLLRLGPKRESSSASPSPSPPLPRSTALVAGKMAKRLKRCTICAVDARGRFLVEDGGAYVMGAARTKEETARICKAERGIFEAKKSRQPQRHPPKQRMPNVYTKFIGVFLATFDAVSVRDASVAWRGFSKEVKRDCNMDVLIQATKDTGLYTLKTAHR